MWVSEGDHAQVCRVLALWSILEVTCRAQPPTEFSVLRPPIFSFQVVSAELTVLSVLFSPGFIF